MTEDLKALLSQRVELEERIQNATRQGKINALQQIRQIAADFQLTAMDLNRAAYGSKPPKPPAPPKYRDALTGATWTGNGMRPRWLKVALDSGKTLDEFLVPTVGTPATKKASVKKPAKS